jgi:c-di-GMP-binding flagellar brake protein YcgR
MMSITGRKMMDMENLAYAGAGRRIAMEFGTPLEVEIEGMELALSCVLIGMDPDSCLIIRVPALKAIRTLSEGEQISVRYQHYDTLLGFRSTFIKAMSSPVEALFVAYPGVIERLDQRSEERIPSLLQAEIRTKKGEALRGIIADISLTGCRCRIKALDQGWPSVQLDEPITLKWRFPEEPDGEQVASGKVKYLSMDARAMTLGIEFDDIPSATRDLIRAYMSSHVVNYFWDLWMGPSSGERSSAMLEG